MAPEETTPVLTLRDAALAYGNRQLWSGLSLVARPGEFLAVLGAADADLLFGAVDAVSAGDARSALLAAARLAESGRDVGRFFGDLEARRHGDDYMDAYSEAIVRTAEKHAPWYIVPANRKWLRNLIVASVIVKHLKRLELSFPKIKLHNKRIRID